MGSEPLKRNRNGNLLLLAGVFLASALALFLAPATALAGPALEIEHGYAQPDGSTFQASPHGDEYFNYVQTADGFLVQKNMSDQVWFYVIETGAGFAFGPRADEAAPESALTPSALASDAGKTAYAALGGSSYSDAGREPSEIVTLDDIRAVQGPAGINAFSLQTTAQTETSLPLITIVIGFDENEAPETEITANGGTWTAAEQRYSDDYDWYEQLYGGEYSITNFYATMSNGKFSWVPATAETSEGGEGGNTNTFDKAGDGIIHVTLDRNHGNWKSPNAFTDVAADMREAYAEALHEASKYIDFSSYDIDGNGAIEKTEACILFIVAGYEASAGDVAPGTWAGTWNMSSMDKSNPNPELVDEVAINTYITMGETVYVEGSIPAQPMSVGTASHELGHYLGLPDLYDTNYTAYDPKSTFDDYPWLAYDVHAASLMASGSWGRWDAGDGTLVFAPTSLDAYCLEALGYIEPTTVSVDGTYEVSSCWSDGGYRCLKIPTDVEGEYYLVENRQFASFDTGLGTYYRIPGTEDDPSYYNETGGIVVWHVDQSIVAGRGIDETAALGEENTVNTVDHRPGVMPVYLELSSYFDGDPLIPRPFYNAAALDEFGLDSLELLLYDGCATPAERVASSISLSIGENASDDMSVAVDMPEQRAPETQPSDTDVEPVEVEVEAAQADASAVAKPLARTGDDAAGSIAAAFALAAGVTLLCARLRLRR